MRGKFTCKPSKEYAVGLATVQSHFWVFAIGGVRVNMTDPIPGRYRHFKGGEYEVVGIARHSETQEQLVVYRPLYNSTGLWVRPVAMFLERVEHEGRTLARFEYLRPMA